MHDVLPIPDGLHLDPQSAFTGGPAPHDVSDDVELALALCSEGEPFRGVGEQAGSDFWGWVGVPVVGLLGAADDSAAV